jgi:hypothetical protein
MITFSTAMMGLALGLLRIKGKAHSSAPSSSVFLQTDMSKTTSEWFYLV